MAPGVVVRERTPHFHVDVLSLPIAVILVSRDGSILDANETCAAELGYTLGYLRGRSVTDLVPRALRAKHALHVERYWAAPAVRRMGFPSSRVAILDAKGRERRAQIGLMPCEEEDCVAAIIWPWEHQLRWWNRPSLGLALSVLTLGVGLHFLEGLRETGLMLVGVASAKLAALARPGEHARGES